MRRSAARFPIRWKDTDRKVMKYKKVWRGETHMLIAGKSPKILNNLRWLILLSFPTIGSLLLDVGRVKLAGATFLLSETRQSDFLESEKKKQFSLGHSMLPWGSESKESACNAGDLDLMLGLERSLGGGHGNPLQYSCLENPHGQRRMEATVHEVAKSWTWLSG